MSKKIKVGILSGGKSAEHEVSLKSAKNIFDAIDKDKYDASLIKINNSGKIIDYSIEDLKNNFDVIFPILHGPFGEDGTMQGLLKFLDIPFVGPSVLGSAVGMDKDVMKRLLVEAGIKIGKYLVFSAGVGPRGSDPEIKEIGFPMFVKPANLGSSVGISKVEKVEDLAEAIEEAFKYDNKIIIEENIDGREIECAILGNDKLKVSALGEIKVNSDFYSYESKYLDEKSSELIIPAEVNVEIKKEIQKIAKKVFKVLCCEGMGRVDFFLSDNNEIFVNEINTIPGFTSKSMYPKLFEEIGISYSDLIDNLITLALERHKQEKILKISVK